MKIPEPIRILWTQKIQPYIHSLSPKQQFLACFCGIVLLLWVVKALTNLEYSRFERDPAINGEVLASDSVKPLSPELKLAEEPAIEKRKWPYYHRPIRSWNDLEFNDVQDHQMTAALANGLKRPIHSREEAEQAVKNGQLVFMGANPMFYMEDLQHSVPYLVPKAYRLLNRIGLNFMDSLVSKQLPVHALVVTSVTRTQDDISNLQKRNGNATTNSCHLYATTFDISWRSFKEIGEDYSEHTAEREVALKRTLGEVLRDLRYEGRCYVKHEQKQSCFHITVR
ncbi:MAG: hypothetical protein HUJ99_07830 [Bacteroidaceae bacterium]|nr:hypothetical protein [Bacteroidaceae bacterium]